jgi:hypothetical protein
MKSIINFLVIVIVAIQIISCGSDPAKESEEIVFLNKLSNAWQVNAVDIDGEDATGAFDGLAITFTDTKTLTVINPVDPIWPATGSFTLVKSGDTFSIDRNDGVIITILELTETSLIMSLNYSAGSRVSSVSGEYTFEMNQ